MQIYSEILSCSIGKIFQNLFLYFSQSSYHSNVQPKNLHTFVTLLSGFVCKGDFDAFIHQHNISYDRSILSFRCFCLHSPIAAAAKASVIFPCISVFLDFLTIILIVVFKFGIRLSFDRLQNLF